MRYYRSVNHKGQGRKAHLHTDPECNRLQKAKDYRPVDRDKFSDAPICPVCTGDVEPPTDQDRSHYNALLEASNE